jgi:hypothetical protein
MPKRRICVVTGSRAEWRLLVPLLRQPQQISVEPWTLFSFCNSSKLASLPLRSRETAWGPRLEDLGCGIRLCGVANAAPAVLGHLDGGDSLPQVSLV